MSKKANLFLIIGVSLWMLCALFTIKTIYHAQAEEPLRFNPKIPETDIMFTQESYKQTRSKEICTMAKEKGFNESDCPLMIAHLLNECGAMTEDCDWKEGSARSDHGFAFGIAQWHACWRNYDWAHKKREGLPNGYCWKTIVGDKVIMNEMYSKAVQMRAEYYEYFPYMKDWRGQAERYISEIDSCMDGFRTLDFCIDTWNSSSGYMSKVYSQLSLARSLLL